MGKIVYHGGDYVDESKALVGVSSLAMRYGLSVFEGVRAYLSNDGRLRPFLLDAHLARLKDSARMLGLPDPGIDTIPEIIAHLLEVNGIREDCYVRPSIHAHNVGDMGATLASSMTVSVKPMARKKWLSEDTAAKVTISSWRKARHDVFPPALKCVAAYAIPFVADHVARAAGYDFPVFLNDEGCLSEAPTAAIFIVTGKRLRTPSLDQAILPSVTRQVVIDLARNAGLDVAEGRIMPHELYAADEAFLCGTGLEIAPVASVDSYVLKSHAERPVTRQLVKQFFDLVRA